MMEKIFTSALGCLSVLGFASTVYFGYWACLEEVANISAADQWLASCSCALGVGCGWAWIHRETEQ